MAEKTYKPPPGAGSNARKGLEWRKEYNRGGTEVGVARARDLMNGASFPISTVKRIYSFFRRHEVDKQGKGFRPGTEGYPSAGAIAWALWGGDTAYAWATRIVRSESNK